MTPFVIMRRHPYACQVVGFALMTVAMGWLAVLALVAWGS